MSAGSNHTPGPLKVSVVKDWPFPIVTRDQTGRIVFSRSMPAYSTRQTTLRQVMAGWGMEDDKAAAIKENARAVADEVLRAAAPELLEALIEACELIDSAPLALKRYKSVIAKATGDAA